MPPYAGGDHETDPAFDEVGDREIDPAFDEVGDLGSQVDALFAHGRRAATWDRSPDGDRRDWE